jgi:hypothetical protein
MALETMALETMALQMRPLCTATQARRGADSLHIAG